MRMLDTDIGNMMHTPRYNPDASDVMVSRGPADAYSLYVPSRPVTACAFVLLLHLLLLVMNVHARY